MRRGKKNNQWRERRGGLKMKVTRGRSVEKKKIQGHS